VVVVTVAQDQGIGACRVDAEGGVVVEERLRRRERARNGARRGTAVGAAERRASRSGRARRRLPAPFGTSSRGVLEAGIVDPGRGDALPVMFQRGVRRGGVLRLLRVATARLPVAAARYASGRSSV
jgi:hypothetical protein